MGVPVSTYIEIATKCQYLSADGNAKKLLFQGGGNRPLQSRLIYMMLKSVEYLYGINTDDTALPLQANYMYSLCNPYVAEANRINGSGQIINPSTGNTVTILTPNPQFRVGNPGALMTAGETSITFNYAGVVNPSLEITLDGVEVPYGDPDVFSFTATYNANNVQVVFNLPVQNGWYLNFHMIQVITS